MINMVNKNKHFKFLMALVICCFFIESILGIITSIHFAMEKQVFFEFGLSYYIFLLILATSTTIYFLLKKHKQIIKNKN